MSRATIILRGQADRLRAVTWAQKAPAGTRIDFKAARRSTPQNSKLWAMLTDIACQVEWYGQKHSTQEWKDIFTAALRTARVVPGIDPGTKVILGMHTSDMSKEEMSDLFELMNAFGAEHGVKFGDDQEAAA